MFRPIKTVIRRRCYRSMRRKLRLLMVLLAETCSEFLQNRTDFITKVLVCNWIVVRVIDVRQSNKMATPTTVIKFKRVLFNDAVDCWDYTASVVDESMTMEHRWNDTDRKKTDGLGEKKSHCHFVCKKFHKKGLVLKLGLHDERPRTNSLNHGTGHLTLNIPRGVLWGPQRVIFCDPAVTITTNLLLIFVCVPQQLKINIMQLDL